MKQNKPDPRLEAKAWLSDYMKTRPRPGGLFLQQDMIDAYVAGKEGK